jgi:hypothetical protein
MGEGALFARICERAFVRARVGEEESLTSLESPPPPTLQPPPPEITLSALHTHRRFKVPGLQRCHEVHSPCRRHQQCILSNDHCRSVESGVIIRLSSSAIVVVDVKANKTKSVAAAAAAAACTTSPPRQPMASQPHSGPRLEGHRGRGHRLH